MTRRLHVAAKAKDNIRKVISPINIRYFPSSPIGPVQNTGEERIVRGIVKDDAVKPTSGGAGHRDKPSMKILVDRSDPNTVDQRSSPRSREDRRSSGTVASCLVVTKGGIPRRVFAAPDATNPPSPEKASNKKSEVTTKKAQHRLKQFERATFIVNGRYQSVLNNITSILASRGERINEIAWRNARQELDDSANDIKYHMRVYREFMILGIFTKKCIALLKNETPESEQKRNITYQFLRAIHQRRRLMMAQEYRHHTASTWRKYSILRLHYLRNNCSDEVYRIWLLSEEVTRPLDGLIEYLDILERRTDERLRAACWYSPSLLHPYMVAVLHYGAGLTKACSFLEYGWRFRGSFPSMEVLSPLVVQVQNDIKHTNFHINALQHQLRKAS